MKDFADVFGSLKNPGKWYTEPLTGAQFRIAQITSPSVQEYCLKNDINLGAGVTEELARKLLAEAVIIDWKGIVIEGEEVKYTPEKALELINLYNPILMWVNKISSEDSNKMMEVISEQGKKSKR